MPRPNYGNAVKQRTLQLFSILVDYANQELDCDDRLWENFQRTIQVHWQTDRRCVVRTKVRYLEDLTRLVGQPLTGEQIKESIKCLMDFLAILTDHRPSKGGSETWHFSLNLWYARHDRAANLDRLVTEWDRRKSLHGSAQISSAVSEVKDFWFDLVRDSLTSQEYHRLTTNPLMVGDGLTFNLEQVYVPLGLAKRSRINIQDEIEPTLQEGDDTAEIDPPTIQDVDEFIAQLMANSEPQRIGIIGEPGSGKTTFLQRLALGLLHLDQEEKVLPIWISLADLQGETLEHYLLHDWLKIATRRITIDPQLQQDLVTQFNRQRVWLLLDAVDEMLEGASTSLAQIARQLRGWVGSAQIVLTCRSNVWDSGKNALETFITYRNLSLSHGYTHPTNQVQLFIHRWFASRPEIGEKLCQELAQPHRQRLRDSIKNPLRLALLCRSWSLVRGNLPTTKFSLYQQFTDTIYEWKQDRFPTNLAQRLKLNRALAELALTAIVQKEQRFRLRQQFVLSILDPDLLELALQIGWLNQAGSNAKGEKIYAFYHPTFQEYFAAQAIYDGAFFLTSVNFNPGQNQKILPIFSDHWQETILFWLGRSDIDRLEKEAFIQALVDFPDRGGGFYRCRAYFLAAAALVEYPEYAGSSQLIEQLLQWRFAKFDPAGEIWQFYPTPIQAGARVALRHTDRQLAINGLTKFVQTVNNPFIRWQSAHSLGKVFDPGNPIAIQALTELIDLLSPNHLLIKVCESLAKIDPQPNLKAIDTLTHIIYTDRELLRRKAAFTLGKIDPTNPLAIEILVNIIQSSNNRTERITAQKNLKQIAPDHPIHQILLVTPRITHNKPKYRQKTRKLPDLSVRITALEQRLTQAQDRESQRRLAHQLGQLQPGNPHAVHTLLTLLTSSQPSGFYKRTGEYLREILTDEHFPLIISSLYDMGIAAEQSLRSMNEPGNSTSQALAAYKILWYCAEQLSDRVFYE
jgi:hypothetical protein